MAMRTYGQYCGLAMAMDLIGQRWAALVIRDLAPGPRRFTDLFEGLPGVATDVLADRLRALEAAGVIRQRAIKHPAPAKVYELTDTGRELESIMKQLAQWGQQLLPSPTDTDARFLPRWALQAMAANYRGGVEDGTYGVTVEGEQLAVVVTGDDAHLEYGTGPQSPKVTIHCDTAEAFFTIAQRPSTLRRSSPGVRVDGPRDTAAALIKAIPLPATV